MKLPSVLASILSSQRLAWRKSRINAAPHWFLGLIGIAMVLGIVDPHPPLIGLAVVAGMTLSPRRSIGLSACVWLVNVIQIYGGPTQPISPASLIWALVTGLGVIGVAGLAAIQSARMPKSLLASFLWVALISLTGLTIVETLHLGFWNVLGGYGMTVEVFTGMLLKELFWAIALTSGWWIVARSVEQLVENPLQCRDAG